MTLNDLGWSPALQEAFQPFQPQGYIPARVAQQHRGQYVVLASISDMVGEMDAEVSGRFRHEAASPEEFPAVGDWIVLEPNPTGAARIRAVLPRKTIFRRRASGNVAEAQVVATNVDTLFLVTGLDGDFNLRRIERYVTSAWESGATPFIVLNKADLCDDVARRVEEVEMGAMGVPVFAVSALENEGIEQLRERIRPGQTAAFVGSSGAGKSSLINHLLGEERMATGHVREDDSRGRHTTTHRELVAVPGGGLLIDTPGMRELQLWAEEEVLDQSFGDIAALGNACRFRDCGHHNEPGCAVQAALRDGSLDSGRYRSYQKLQRELAYLERQRDEAAQRAEHQRWKNIAKTQRRHGKVDPKRQGPR